MAEANERRISGRERRENVPSHDGKDGRRVFRHEVTANPAEEEQLRARAAVRGVTIPRLLFESAMSSNIVTASDRRDAIAEVFAVRRLMANVANNVNQLAHFANTESVFPAEAERVVAEYRDLVPVFTAAAEKLARS